MSVFVIAEIGINHNGSFDLCKQLIDIASDAGCNAVKFQKRTIELVYSQEYLDSFRDSPWGNTQRHQKQALEFDKSEYDLIDRYCKFKGLEWFASAWDIKSQVFLRQYQLNYNKIASPMLTNVDLVELIASEKKYTFISTGMSTLQQIDTTVSIFHKHECPYELMHSVSMYPLHEGNANLRCIETLRKRYGCKVGYSGHESGLAITLAAVALGSTSIERHITIDRAMYGSDQSASLEPSGLRQLVGGIRKIEIALGDGVKKIIPEEISTMNKLRLGAVI